MLSDAQWSPIEGMLPRPTRWSRQRIPAIIDETLVAIEGAVRAIAPPDLASKGMPERIEWNVSRLRAGAEISRPKK